MPYNFIQSIIDRDPESLYSYRTHDLIKEGKPEEAVALLRAGDWSPYEAERCVRIAAAALNKGKPRAKQYRLQASNYQGLAKKRTIKNLRPSWSPWRTIKAFPTLELAAEVMRKSSRTGLSRWRVVYGSEIKLSSY